MDSMNITAAQYFTDELSGNNASISATVRFNLDAEL